MTICNFGTGKGGLDPTLRSTERPPPAVFQKQNMAEHLRPDAQLREFGRVSGVKIRSSLAGLAAPDSFREELLSEVMRMGAQILRNLFLFLQGLVNSK